MTEMEAYANNPDVREIHLLSQNKRYYKAIKGIMVKKKSLKLVLMPMIMALEFMMLD